MSTWKERILLPCIVASALGGIVGVLQFFGVNRVSLIHANWGWAILAAVFYAIPVITAIYFQKTLSAVRKRIHDSTALEILKCQCQGILHEYRHLDHDYPNDVQYPLSDSSVPDFGLPWKYIHVELTVLKRHLKYIIELAKGLWSRMNWQTDHVQLFSVAESTKILDLILALEDFLQCTPRPSK